MAYAKPPNETDLPSSAQLVRSTAVAAVAAAVLLIAVVLPSEYGLDPTGIGRVLGLTQMGEIKEQLAREADAELAAPATDPSARSDADRLADIERRLETIAQLLAARHTEPQAVAVAEEPAAEEKPSVPAADFWRDEITITLKPGQGIELKLVMRAGAEAEFEWLASGGALNFDTHGDGSGNSISYEKGRGMVEDRGVLKAAFDGNHGWFWRNRTGNDVTLTLRTRGDYSGLKRTA